MRSRQNRLDTMNNRDHFLACYSIDVVASYVIAAVLLEIKKVMLSTQVLLPFFI